MRYRLSAVMVFPALSLCTSAALAGDPPRPPQALSLEQFRKAWTADADVKDQPARAALEKLAGELRLKLAAAQDPALAKPVSVKLAGCTKLQAIEEICRSAGFHPVYTESEIQLKRGARKLPAVFAGPFILEVAGVKREHGTGTGTLHLRLRAFGLPLSLADAWQAWLDRFVPMFFFLTALDAKGRDLVDPGAWYGTGYKDSAPGQYDQSPSLALRNLLREVREIASLRARVWVRIPTRVETMAFTKLQKGESQKAGGVEVTLTEVSAGEAPQFTFSTKGAETLTLVWTPLDAKGGPLEKSMEWGSANSMDLVCKAAPASIQVALLATEEDLPFDFEFRDIPLEPDPTAPETIAAIEFAGHEAPVSMEFLEIVPDKRPPKAKWRIVNRSNKAVRSLGLKLRYLDVAGRELQARPKQETGQPFIASIVAERATAELETTEFFLPEKTKTIQAEVEEVSFFDASAWRPKIPGFGGEIAGFLKVMGPAQALDVLVECLGRGPDGKLEHAHVGFQLLRGTTSSLTCTNWEPRNSTLAKGGPTGYRHEHVHRAPGDYLVSVRVCTQIPDGHGGRKSHSEGYADWKWVRLEGDDARAVADLTIDPAAVGTVEVVLTGPSAESDVTYLPLDPDGKLPFPEAHSSLGRTNAAKLDKGKAIIHGLREGKYQIALGPFDPPANAPSVFADVEVKRGETARVELKPVE